MNVGNLVGDSTLAIMLTSGLTQSAKTMFPSVADRFAYVVSILVGVLVTSGLDYATFSPGTPQDWVLVVLHGMVVGLSASGLYKVASAIAVKAK